MRIDKSFYEEWTFVPLNFVTFNLGKKISHFYGKHYKTILYTFNQILVVKKRPSPFLSSIILRQKCSS